MLVPSSLRLPAPVNQGYKDFPICQAMGIHNLTAKLQVIQDICSFHTIYTGHIVDLHANP